MDGALGLSLSAGTAERASCTSMLIRLSGANTSTGFISPRVRSLYHRLILSSKSQRMPFKSEFPLAT